MHYRQLASWRTCFWGSSEVALLILLSLPAGYTWCPLALWTLQHKLISNSAALVLDFVLVLTSFPAWSLLFCLSTCPFTLNYLWRFLTHIFILNRIYPFLVHRYLLPEKSSRCIYLKWSKLSNKALLMRQALKTIKSASSESKKTTRAVGNLENRQEDYAMRN